MLTKITVETALNVELDDHLGFERHAQFEDGQSPLDTLRDCAGSFEPPLVKKHQRRFTSMDDNILFFYAQGMTTREIVAPFNDMYGADVSATLISKVIAAVTEQVVEWQVRRLAAIYPIVYLDCIVVKLRQDEQVINKVFYLEPGVNMGGHKALLGSWLSKNEGAKLWLNRLAELQSRGVKDIPIACVDGLKGFPETNNPAFPATQVQLYIVHMIRNSLK
jgi:transposase-like protein